MSNSRSGSQKILKLTHSLTKVKSTNISSDAFTSSWSLLCFADWRMTLSWKLDRRQSSPNLARWLIDREYSTKGLRTRSQWKICLHWQRTNRRWRIWWILLCNSGRSAITLSYLKEGLGGCLWHSKNFKWGCSRIHCFKRFLISGHRWKIL